MVAGAGEQLVQPIKSALQQLHIAAFDLGATSGDGFQQRFDAVAKIADGVDAGHACATLQGMQVTLQAGQHLAVLRRIAQLADQAITVVEQVLAFLDEDVDQLAIVDTEVERIGAVFRHRDVKDVGCHGFNHVGVRRANGRGIRYGIGIGSFGVDFHLARRVFQFEEPHRFGGGRRRGLRDLLIHRRRGRLIGALSFTDRRLPADVRILGKGFRLARREFAGLQAEHGPLPVVGQGLLFVDHVQAGLERGVQRDRFCKPRRSHFILQARQLAVEWQCSRRLECLSVRDVHVIERGRIQVRCDGFDSIRNLFGIAVVDRQRTGIQVRRQIVHDGQTGIVGQQRRAFGLRLDTVYLNARNVVGHLDRFDHR